jgi:hypothetical protein
MYSPRAPTVRFRQWRRTLMLRSDHSFETRPGIRGATLRFASLFSRGMPDGLCRIGKCTNGTETFRRGLPKSKHVMKSFCRTVQLVRVWLVWTMCLILVIWEHRLFFHAKWMCRLVAAEVPEAVVRSQRHWSSLSTVLLVSFDEARAFTRNRDRCTCPTWKLDSMAVTCSAVIYTVSRPTAVVFTTREVS